MIPEHVMRELRYIELRSSRRMRNPRLGMYTSRLRGPGFDFDEHQPYRPGDDVRRIDWNVTARMDAPYVRHTHAERELNMIAAVDVSRSMTYGTTAYSKRETMMFITASLLFSALSDQIMAGFQAFSDRVLAYSPPQRTRAAAWANLERCWAASDSRGRTALLPAVRHLLGTLKRTSIVFLVSDFLSNEDWATSADLAMLAARHDVIAVVPEDAGERQLPGGQGFLRVQDVESGRQTTVALGRRARLRQEADAANRRGALKEAFHSAGLAHVFVPTEGSPVEPLMELFAGARR